MSPLGSIFSTSQDASIAHFPFSEYRFTPHYPVQAPLEALFHQILPGSDEYVLEKYAFDISQLLNQWGEALRAAPPALAVLAKLAADSLETTPLVPNKEIKVRNANGLEVVRRIFPENLLSGRERFLQEMKTYLSTFARIKSVEFEIVAIKPVATAPNTYEIDIRYELGWHTYQQQLRATHRALAHTMVAVERKRLARPEMASVGGNHQSRQRAHLHRRHFPCPGANRIV